MLFYDIAPPGVAELAKADPEVVDVADVEGGAALDGVFARAFAEVANWLSSAYPVAGRNYSPTLLTSWTGTARNSFSVFEVILREPGELLESPLERFMLAVAAVHFWRAVSARSGGNDRYQLKLDRAELEKDMALEALRSWPIPIAQAPLLRPRAAMSPYRAYEGDLVVTPTVGLGVPVTIYLASAWVSGDRQSALSEITAVDLQANQSATVLQPRPASPLFDVPGWRCAAGYAPDRLYWVSDALDVAANRMVLDLRGALDAAITARAVVGPDADGQKPWRHACYRNLFLRA